MRKITSLLVLVSFVFFSCETEPLNDDGLNAIEARGGVKKEKPENDECIVNLTPDLPATATACADAKPGSDAYFDLSIADGPLAGTYGAWCVDVARTLDAGTCFDADVYSSYETLPAGAVDKPENMDLINWILNQNFVGMMSSNGVDPYTLGDVQWAMWEVIDDANCVSCTYLTPYDAARAQEIVDMAEANGEGYEPGAGDMLAIVLVPQTGEQVVIIPQTIECEPECETAFARDTDGANCFLDNGFSRWGWSIQLPDFGDYEYDIYAGAGQCDISKGAMVGTVSISYDAGGIEVTYNILPGYTLDETHTYAGAAMFPMNDGADTVAPGQYYIEDNLSGSIYVIAHAVVCGDGDE